MHDNPCVNPPLKSFHWLCFTCPRSNVRCRIRDLGNVCKSWIFGFLLSFGSKRSAINRDFGTESLGKPYFWRWYGLRFCWINVWRRIWIGGGDINKKEKFSTSIWISLALVFVFTYCSNANFRFHRIHRVFSRRIRQSYLGSWEVKRLTLQISCGWSGCNGKPYWTSLGAYSPMWSLCGNRTAASLGSGALISSWRLPISNIGEVIGPDCLLHSVSNAWLEMLNRLIIRLIAWCPSL